jgi:hypothetical protein
MVVTLHWLVASQLPTLRQAVSELDEEQGVLPTANWNRLDSVSVSRNGGDAALARC